MLADEKLLNKAKKLIEARLGWGNSAAWTNQDFLALSDKLQEEIGISVSHSTLKRIWGKVKSDSLPNTYTLNILAQFAGFENWRDFKIKSESDPGTNGEPGNITATPDKKKSILLRKRKTRLFKPMLFAAGLIALAIFISLFIYWKKKKINPGDYTFSSKKVLTVGVPNSVIFDYDASKAPTDSVMIQQSWDKRLRTTVPKDKHQYTSIYYFPDFYKAKLVIDGQIVKEHNLLIKSDGWLTAVETQPVPVYFKKEDVIANGKMSLSIDKIKAQNINLSPRAPFVLYSNVQDFGEIYSDDFVFEASLKNDYREGSAICQTTNIYVLCEGTSIGIPLVAKGCESDIYFSFTDLVVSGKQHDLSCFGVNFNDFIKLRIESKNAKAKIFLNDKLTYEVNSGITRAKIIGIDFVFQGSGTVDYVKLSNKNLTFEDGF